MGLRPVRSLFVNTVLAIEKLDTSYDPTVQPSRWQQNQPRGFRAAPGPSTPLSPEFKQYDLWAPSGLECTLPISLAPISLSNLDPWLRNAAGYNRPFRLSTNYQALNPLTGHPSSVWSRNSYHDLTDMRLIYNGSESVEKEGAKKAGQMSGFRAPGWKLQEIKRNPRIESRPHYRRNGRLASFYFCSEQASPPALSDRLSFSYFSS